MKHKPSTEECSEMLWQMHISVSEFYNEYAKSVGLTLTALKVITILYKEEKCTQKYIAQLTYLPKQTVNTIINKFYKENYLEDIIEDNSDKRNKLIKLTPEGRKYAENIIKKAKEAEYRALDAIGEERREALLEAITLYRNNLEIK